MIHPPCACDEELQTLCEWHATQIAQTDEMYQAYSTPEYMLSSDEEEQELPIPQLSHIPKVRIFFHPPER